MTALVWIGYLRVSTDEQMKGEGIEVQRDAINAAALAQGASVIEWCTDEAISGSNGIDTRLGLAEAIDWLAVYPGAAIVVAKLDRLARDLMMQESLLADIWRHGGNIWSCDEGEQPYCKRDDPADPSRKFIRQVLGAVAEYERGMIRLRMVAGRRRKLAETGYAGGKVPYGWRQAIPEGIEPDPVEQAVLASVSEWRRLGVTWDGCVEELNTTGVLKRNGSVWRKADLHKTYTRASGAWAGVGVNPETINVGDKLNMTDLRKAETYPVTVEEIDARLNGYVRVRRDDNGARYRVHRGFLTVREQA